jgi:hypothetical protein
MFIMISDVLVNLANVKFIDRDPEEGLAVATFVDGNVRKLDCYFEDLCLHLGVPTDPPANEEVPQ